LLGFGAVKLFHPSLRKPPRIPGLFCSPSGRVFGAIAKESSSGWRAAFNIQGPGGWAGYFFGRTLLLNWMGKVGWTFCSLAFTRRH
jgi:hypothetical protein